MSCAAGPGGGGCFGFAWWQNDSNYEADVWDPARDSKMQEQLVQT